MSSVPHTVSENYARIGVIGDIHTRVDRLEWALGVLHAQEVDRLFATGDIVDGPYPEAIAQICGLLHRNNVVTVLGNHDRWLLDQQHRELAEATFPEDVDRESREFLQALPQSVELRMASMRLLFGHGLGANDMTSLYPYDHGPSLTNNDTLQTLLRGQRYQYVISGHTHVRMVRDIAGVTFINAGALHYTREPCCLLLDLVNRQAQFFDQAPDGSTVRGPHHSL